MTESPQPFLNQISTALISAVKTPLNFLVLGLLLLELLIKQLIPEAPKFDGVLIWTAVFSVAGFVLVVVGLAIFFPEALRGERHLQRENATKLGTDLYLALEGPIRNLEKGERTEAWITVSDIITSGHRINSTYHTFCQNVSEQLKTVVAIKTKKENDLLEGIAKDLLRNSLSNEHLKILTTQFSRDPGRAYITLSIMANNKKQLHADLEKCFTDAGYKVKTWIAMQTKITHDNLSLRVPNVEQLTPRQALVLTALRNLNFEVVVEHEPDHPANEFPTDIWLMVR